MDNDNLEKLATFGIYEPKDTPILYHYCDLNTFLAIIQNSTIRFSDINTMNDYGESHWPYQRFIEAINIEKSKYPIEFYDNLDEIISQMQTKMLPAISCFSMDGDVLSQWRSYADDGRGVSIGFDGDKIRKLSVKFGKIVYDRAEQIDFFKSLFATVYPAWNSLQSDGKLRGKFIELVMYHAVDMCLMKNPAFAEEKEIRLTRILTPHKDGTYWRLSDKGGSSADKASKKSQNIKYRSRNGGLIAYVDLPFSGLGKSVIREVVIGPKSNNNGNEVSMALTSFGFKDFKIIKSKATYR